jgi:glycosyltransferase involved in cell wall biosynthesis
MEMTPPLVTFIVLGYRQDRYIREAIEGAFSQTYSPLEIILSDDCSSDKTFQIMEEMAASYSGPHRIILNKNPINLGIGSHVNKLVEIAQGKLIVMSAGDDISLPNRVDVLVDEWIKRGKPGGIASRMYIIDSNGKNVGLTSIDDKNHEDTSNSEKWIETCLTGASAAWSRDIITMYGKLNHDVVQEDHAFSFRCCMTGGLAYIDTPLVYYRKHDLNIWGRLDGNHGREEETKTKRAKWFSSLYSNMLKDLEYASSINKILRTDFEINKSILVKRLYSYKVRANCWDM